MNTEFSIKINHNRYTEITREADPNEEWDGDDLSSSHSFNGYQVVKNGIGYWDFILSENPNKKPLYLVYVLHSDGDSFHSEEGCICMVSLVDNYEDAVKIRNAISSDESNRDKNSYKSHQLEITLSTGKVEKIYCGDWQGYFTRFESVNIEPLEYTDEH